MVRKPFVAFAGCMASGKTTLAKEFARMYQWTFLPEPFEGNAFLADSRQSGAMAFETQVQFIMDMRDELSFLNSRFPHALGFVADYVLANNEAYEKSTLIPQQAALARRLRKHYGRTAAEPDFIVYLRSDTPSILERIRERGRPFENQTGARFIDDLIQVFDEHFTEKCDTPHIKFDTTNLGHPSTWSVVEKEEVLHAIKSDIESIQFDWMS